MATGRSDYPNQVNNVLGFPFIFRGALDVYATAINEEMKKAASYALAKLAKEEVPDSVKRAYGVTEMTFGPDYIIPKPFDPRVLTWVAPAVAKAAMDTGVARRPIEDFEQYKISLDVRMGRTQSIMTKIYQKASLNPPRIVFPEGDHPRIIKSAQTAVDDKLAVPILLGNEENIKRIAAENHYELDGIEIVDPVNFEKFEDYFDEFYRIRQRKGITKERARELLLSRRNYFGSMMLQMGDACGMISGLTTTYPETIRPALQVIGKQDKYSIVSGMYVVSTPTKTYFLADTTVNLDPDANQLSDIALQAAEFARNFDIEPKVALLSYSNFGSAKGESVSKMQKALQIIKMRNPELIVEGEMQADTAVVPEIMNEMFPFSSIKNGANILIFPNLDAGNIAYKVLSRIGEAHIIGPILLGLNKSVHVLQRGSELNQIHDMISIAAVDAQQKVC
jgi:malate dehydrogenase (oxaloacetate-decarboxylating)(NADP+)